MRGIKSDDRVLVYKIECARFSFALLEKSWEALRNSTRNICHRNEIDDKAALTLFSESWQLVDFATRLLNVLKTIPKINRKDSRYREFEKIGGLLTKVRNYIQHVDSETHKLKQTISYPILGALAWGTSDGSASIAISLGTLPANTTFHTVAYDSHISKYLDEILLGVGSLTLSLSTLYAASCQVASLLEEHLVSEDLVTEDELQLGFLRADGIETPEKDLKRFLRVKVTIGQSSTQ